MRMSKSKRIAAANAAANKPFVIAYGLSATCQRPVRLYPRYGPQQFQMHLENLQAMAQTSGDIARHASISLFLAGAVSRLWIGRVIYENLNAKFKGKSLFVTLHGSLTKTEVPCSVI